MEKASEGGQATESYTRSRLAHLERILQELSRHEERSTLQSVERTSMNTKQRLLNDQLLQTQEELAAAQASKAKLCEEIGALQQTKEDQAKQIAGYKMDLQTSRESQSMLAKKMEELETSARTMKQNYIKSLAIRMKTTAQLLQRLQLTNETAPGSQLAEKCSETEHSSPNKRKRMNADETRQADKVGGKPESTETTSEREFQTTAVQTDLPIESTVVPTPITSNPVLDLLKKRLKSPAHLSHLAKKNDEEKEDRRALSERALAQLHAQVTQLKGDFSKLEDKYQALEHERDMLVTDKKMSANDIEAKQTQVDELMQLLDLERSKHPIAAAEPKEMPAGELDPSPHQDDSELQNRVKMLEDNVAQMNAYADQLEMVIAQCPSCTNKLQNGSTQDFAAEDKAE